MLDYNQLEALAAVVEEGGFERAGQRLHVTQSAVTQRVRQLEDRMGQILLIRSQPPGLTRQGRILLEHFSKVRLLEKELTLLDRTGEDRELPLIPLAVNADSLATWFSSVVAAFFKAGEGLLDIRSADQDVTHALLARGEVMGCISASGESVRGCRSEYLGEMVYRLVGTEGFQRRYFPRGIMDQEGWGRAPKINFNRDDQLLNSWSREVFPEGEEGFAMSHFIPSSEQFPLLIRKGDACGMVTEEQFQQERGEGGLVDLSMGHPVAVALYWHRWSIESRQLDLLSRIIRQEARKKLGIAS